MASHSFFWHLSWPALNYFPHHEIHCDWIAAAVEPDASIVRKHKCKLTLGTFIVLKFVCLTLFFLVGFRSHWVLLVFLVYYIWCPSMLGLTFWNIEVQLFKKRDVKFNLKILTTLIQKGLFLVVYSEQTMRWWHRKRAWYKYHHSYSGKIVKWITSRDFEFSINLQLCGKLQKLWLNGCC